MNSDKILYWVALSAVVLAMSHEYRGGRFPATHRAVTNAENTLCHLVTRAERTLAMAELVFRAPAATTQDMAAMTDDLNQEQVELLRARALEQAELVRDQVRAQAEELRARAEMQRAQIEQMRGVVQSRFHLSRTADRRVIVCPETGVRITDRRAADPDDDVDIDIQTGDSF
jgi:hypothetical protein